jgi:hypothetical protein
MDATDVEQLLAATAQGRCIFTFNIRDFQVLAQRYPHHSGIILAVQRSWPLSSLISALEIGCSLKLLLMNGSGRCTG